jgi:hypothetical protein
LSEDLCGHPIPLHFFRWLSQLILCTFIHFTIFSPLLNSSSSRFVLLFHSPFSYLGPYILLNTRIFLSKISYFLHMHYFTNRTTYCKCLGSQKELQMLIHQICSPEGLMSTQYRWNMLL